MPRSTGRQYAFPERTTAERQRQVAAVVWAIALDGPFQDDGGGASELLRTAMWHRGVMMEKGNLNSILKEMDYTHGKYGYLIQRTVNGKRTMAIELKVDPYKDPVPPNPWPASKKAAYQGRGDSEPVEVDGGDDGFDDLEETFSRQALAVNGQAEPEEQGEAEDPVIRLKRLSDRIAARDEPEPESEVEEPEVEAPEVEEAEAEADELDVEPELEPTVDVVGEIARITTVPVPGVPEANVPNVDAILAGMSVGAPSTNGHRGFSTLLNQAIGLIAAAMTAQIEEERSRQHDDAFDVAKLVDERMAGYVALIERNARLEEGLRRSHQREQELVGLVRTLQTSNETLHAQMSRS